MSANNARAKGGVEENPGEGQIMKSPNFESPNITSAEVEEQKPVVDEAAEARKKAETVEIDGIPLKDDEVVFRAEDIKKKKKADLFVNVEGAEERRRAEEKRKREELKHVREEAAVKEKEAKAKAAETAKKEQEAAAARAKKLAEAKKVSDAEAKKQRQLEKREEARLKRTERAAKTHDFFFKGWHKAVTFSFIGVICLCILGYVGYLGYQKYAEEREKKAVEAGIKRDEEALNTPEGYATTNAYECDILYGNYNYVEGTRCYEELIARTERDDFKGGVYTRQSMSLGSFDLGGYDEERYALAKKGYELNKNDPYSIYWMELMYLAFDEPEKAEELKAILEEMQDNEDNNKPNNWFTGGGEG